MQQPDAPPRLVVGVVGAGRVGSVLGAALVRAGHHVASVSAVSDASRQRAADLLPDAVVVPVDEVVRRSELVVLAVPDDALVDLVGGLGATGAWHPGQLVAHTCGRLGLEPFAAAPDHALNGLALHPAMTFTGTSMDLARLQDCAFGVTSEEALRPVAEALVIEMGGEPVWVAPEDRGRYHAALAHASNHLVTLIAQARQVLSEAGIEHPDRVLGPLTSAALDNALRSGDAALTGPVARGDADTVAEHLRQLDALAGVAPDLGPTYRAMARATAQRALNSGRLRPTDAQRLLDLLQPGPNPDAPDSLDR